MTTDSLHLPAKIYKYLSLNEGRSVSFDELYAFACPFYGEDDFSSENFSAKTRHQTHLMQLLVFLSDLNLITLNQFTDESSVNLLSRN